MKLILGMGLTGLSVARFYSKKNIDFRIADSRLSPPMLQIMKQENLLIDFHLGEWNKNLLDDISEIIISPGIAESEKIVSWSRKKSIPIISDIELFGRYAKAPIVGISGSNGKSTVTQLLGEMAHNDGKNAVVCGNIGKPVMDSLSDDADVYIVEISSYQLDYTNKINLLTGVITNITPDHLDRYGDFNAYIESKLSLYSYCSSNIVNLNESLVSKIDLNACYAIDKHGINCEFHANKDGNKFIFFHGSQILMSSEELLVIGRHNVENILAALTLGHQIGLSLKSMVITSKKFKGIEHRLEWVVSLNGVDFFNDSKSTNGISTITAIKAIADKYKSVILIAGGIAKKEDYSELFQLINTKIDTLILIGQSSAMFSKKINSCPVHIVETMEHAVALSKTIALEGAILLSPGCASFDMFNNFSERGETFKYFVLQEN